MNIASVTVAVRRNKLGMRQIHIPLPILLYLLKHCAFHLIRLVTGIVPPEYIIHALFKVQQLFFDPLLVSRSGIEDILHLACAIALTRSIDRIV